MKNTPNYPNKIINRSIKGSPLTWDEMDGNDLYGNIWKNGFEYKISMVVLWNDYIGSNNTDGRMSFWMCRMNHVSDNIKKPGTVRGNTYWDRIDSDEGTLNVNTAKKLALDNTIVDGASGLQFAQYSGGDNPVGGWYSHLIMNHGNPTGYYVDLMASFHDDVMYMRRKDGGVVQPDKRFVMQGDSTNFSSLYVGTGSSTKVTISDGGYIGVNSINANDNLIIRAKGTGGVLMNYGVSGAYTGFYDGTTLNAFINSAGTGSFNGDLTVKGNVAIGTTSNNSYKFKTYTNKNYGIFSEVSTPTISSNSTNYAISIDSNITQSYNVDSGVTDSGYRMGLNIAAYSDTSGLKGTIGDQIGMRIQYGAFTSSGTGTINTAFGIKLEFLNGYGSTTIANAYSIHSNSTAKFYHNGNVLLGTTTDTGHKLNVKGDTYITGNVLLGTTTDTGHKLNVNGNAYIKDNVGINGYNTNYMLYVGGSVYSTAIDVNGNTKITGNVTAATFVKNGGSSNEFLMADGSVSNFSDFLELSTSLNESVTGKGSDATVIKILYDRIKYHEKLIIPSTFLINGASDNNPTLNFKKLDNTELKVVWSDGEVYIASNNGEVSITKKYSIYTDVIASVYCAGEYELVEKCVSSSVKKVVLNTSVTNIGYNAFYNCTSLTSIVISDSVTNVGDSAFSYCTSLTSIVIPDSVTSIGNAIFNSCTDLTSIVIPDSVTNISSSAFSGCRSLTSIVIPDSVTNIDGGAFSSCTSLKSIVIPDSVTNISGGAFGGCISLTSIVIPDSVTNIGGGAFSSCTSLTSVTIGNSVTNISGGTFSSCANLTSIVIPDSVTSIGDSAFSSCIRLTSVTIGNSVTNIGLNTFDNCVSLNTYKFYPLVAPTVEFETFPNNTGVTLHIPSTSTSYNVNPWTNTYIFATIKRDL